MVPNTAWARDPQPWLLLFPTHSIINIATLIITVVSHWVNLDNITEQEPELELEQDQYKATDQ